MLTKENLKTGLVAGLVAGATLLVVAWAVALIRARRAASKTPCGCGGHP